MLSGSSQHLWFTCYAVKGRKEGLLPSWELSEAPQIESKADSLALSSMWQEVLFCFLSSFASFLRLGFLTEGISNLNALVSALPVLCVTNLFIYQLGTTFHLVLLLPSLLCSPDQERHYC